MFASAFYRASEQMFARTPDEARPSRFATTRQEYTFDKRRIHGTFRERPIRENFLMERDRRLNPFHREFP